MTIQYRVAAATLVAVFGCCPLALAAPAGNAPAPAAARGATPPPGAPPHNSSSSQPQVSQDAAARSRMHECGHQWSVMKKAGTTGTLTWKEFSATCLVVSR